ncbi:hypothetical protein HKX48_007998 [Thoreauomyces humboldtii]|nr:hypothetical protein HKX48_007998 [Thoreauomyces humboldtii]
MDSHPEPNSSSTERRDDLPSPDSNFDTVPGVVAENYRFPQPTPEEAAMREEDEEELEEEREAEQLPVTENITDALAESALDQKEPTGETEGENERIAAEPTEQTDLGQKEESTDQGIRSGGLAFTPTSDEIVAAPVSDVPYATKPSSKQASVIGKGKEPLNFKEDMELQSEYVQRKKEVQDAQLAYRSRHQELGDIMADYLQLLLHRKPNDVYAFTSQYFSIQD